jgi:hypothetical protein
MTSVVATPEPALTTGVAQVAEGIDAVAKAAVPLATVVVPVLGCHIADVALVAVRTCPAVGAAAALTETVVVADARPVAGGGGAQVPSARKRFVVPPPDAGTAPDSADVKTLTSAVNCVLVRPPNAPELLN